MELLIDRECSQDMVGPALMPGLERYVDPLTPLPLDPPSMVYGPGAHPLLATEQGNGKNYIDHSESQIQEVDMKVLVVLSLGRNLLSSSSPCLFQI